MFINYVFLCGPFPWVVSGCKMAASMAEQATKTVFDLFRKYGNRDYIGEPVSQQEHMTQCAMLAEKEGYSNEVVLGVFLHDIGHLIGFDKSLPPMGDVGTHAHEIIGEQFLKDLGFPDGVTSFVRGHVDAKRYLVWKYPQYHKEVLKNTKGAVQLGYNISIPGKWPVYNKFCLGGASFQGFKIESRIDFVRHWFSWCKLDYGNDEVSPWKIAGLGYVPTIVS